MPLRYRIAGWVGLTVTLATVTGTLIANQFSHTVASSIALQLSIAMATVEIYLIWTLGDLFHHRFEVRNLRRWVRVFCVFTALGLVTDIYAITSSNFRPDYTGATASVAFLLWAGPVALTSAIARIVIAVKLLTPRCNLYGLQKPYAGLFLAVGVAFALTRVDEAMMSVAFIVWIGSSLAVSILFLRFASEYDPTPADSGKLVPQMPDGNFDVFIAHNSRDKREVMVIVDQLRSMGITPWIDTEQIAPGRSFQKEIQLIIPKVRAAAIFVGPRGLGPWQDLELEAFLSMFVDAQKPVIPVLLPGVETLPRHLVFLRGFHWVAFHDLNDTDAVNRLAWGIRAEKI